MRDGTKNILKEYANTIEKNKTAIEFSKFAVDGFVGVSDTSRLGFTQQQIDDLAKIGEIGIKSMEGETLPRPLQERVNDYDPMTIDVDNRLLAIGSSITTIKSQIVSLVAQAVGTSTALFCATQTGVCTNWSGGISTCLVGYAALNDDLFQTRIQNMSSRSYFGIEPASYSTATLASGNVGVGSFVILSADGGAGLGFTVTLKTTGSNTVGACSTYHTAVTNKYAEIDTLRAEANTLISTVNIARKERVRLHLERWANLFQNNEFEGHNSQLREASDNIQGSTLSPYV